MSEKKQPVDLGLLEEDDEFEEFPAEDKDIDVSTFGTIKKLVQWHIAGQP